MAVRAYVPDSSANNLNVIQDNVIIDSIPMPGAGYGSVVLPNGLFVYVTLPSVNRIVVIRTLDNTIVATLDATGGINNPRGIAASPDSAFVYVAHQGSTNILQIDTSTNTISNVFGGGGLQSPEGIVVDPANQFVYITNIFHATVSKLNIGTSTITTPFSGLFLPIGVEVTPNGQFLYVANGGPNPVAFITKFNAVTEAFMANVIVGGNLPNGTNGLVSSPDSTKIYVSIPDIDSVGIVDVATNSSSPVPGGNYPFGIAVSPDGTRVFIGNQLGGTVTIINNIGTLIATVGPFASVQSLGKFVQNVPNQISKEFGDASIVSGDNTTMTFIVNITQDVMNFSFQDNLPSGIAFNGNISTPAGWTANFPDIGDNGSIQYSFAGLLPLGVYVFEVNVSNFNDQLNPSCSLFPSAFTNDESNTTNNLPPTDPLVYVSDPACLVVEAPPLQTTKSFDVPSMQVGDTAVMTITITNNSGALVTGVSFNDPYPSGLVNANPPNASSTSGIVSATAGDDTLGLTNGSIPASGSLIVTVNVTATAEGVLDNNTGVVTSDQFTDTEGGSASIIITQACPPITLSPSVLPDGSVGTLYSVIMSADGGIAPYVFSTNPADLPPGLTLFPDGALTGTPMVIGSYTFTVNLIDDNGCPGSQTYTMNISARRSGGGGGYPVASIDPCCMKAINDYLKRNA